MALLTDTTFLLTTQPPTFTTAQTVWVNKPNTFVLAITTGGAPATPPTPQEVWSST